MKERIYCDEIQKITWDSLGIANPASFITAEDPGLLRIRSADAAAEDFQPEEFRKWLLMSRGYAKAICLLEASYDGGCTPLTAALTAGGRDWLRAYEFAACRLYEEGYFRQIHVRGLGGFYQLTPKGAAIFNDEETRPFLCEKTHITPTAYEPWETTSDASITVCLQHDALRKMHALKDRYHLKEYSLLRGEEYFLMTFYGAIYGRDPAFAGVVSEDPAAFEAYRKYVTEELEEAKLLIVTEPSQEKAECIAEWTDQITPSEVRVLCYAQVCAGARRQWRRWCQGASV